MKSLYSKFAFTTILIMVCSGLLSFLLSNTHYQVILKKQNDEKILKIASNMADFASRQTSISLEDYFEHIGGIGYQVLLVDQNGNRNYFGSPFR